MKINFKNKFSKLMSSNHFESINRQPNFKNKTAKSKCT